MVGLKKVCAESKQLKGFYDGGYLQINYDKATNKVWSNYHYNLGHNSFTLYDDVNIVNCGNISKPSTMAEIKEIIEEGLRLC